MGNMTTKTIKIVYWNFFAVLQKDLIGKYNYLLNTLMIDDWY